MDWDNPVAISLVANLVLGWTGSLLHHADVSAGVVSMITPRRLAPVSTTGS